MRIAVFAKATFAVLLLTLAIQACGNKKDKGSSTSAGETKKAAEALPEEKTTQYDPVIEAQQKIVGNAFQVKNKLLLENSVESCVGTKDVLKIKANMVLGSNQQSAANTKRFIQQDQTRFALEKFITESFKESLYDPTDADRLATPANALTVDYMQAADMVANVVAQNCDPAQNAKCKCDSPEAAKEFLLRCLPRHEPAEVEKLAPEFAEQCKGTLSQQRAALAGFFSSGAFLEAK